MMKQVLTIAGSDSGAGAGIQADLKTFAACGVYGTSCITSVTAQNSQTVSLINNLDPKIIKAQIKSVLDDFYITHIKIGMIGDLAGAKAVVEILHHYKIVKKYPLIIIYDPVMVSETNAALMNDALIPYIISELIPLVDVITPNLLEASKITKTAITDQITMEKAALVIAEMGQCSVIVKGGHLVDRALDVCYDFLNKKFFYLEKPLLKTTTTHGTGCSFSSAICANLALGMSFLTATTKAKNYVFNGIKYGQKLNRSGGKDPINHFYKFREVENEK